MKGVNEVISFLVPKEMEFFDLFDKEAQNALDTSELLIEFLVKYKKGSKDSLDMSARIKQLEHKGDDLTHEIIGKLHTTFLTPIDHEDIHELAMLLDDEVDLMDALSRRFILYGVDKVPECLVKQIRNAREQLISINKALLKVRHNKRPEEERQRVYALEMDSDVIHAAALKELFENHTDPIEVIKLKELYERAEDITDRAQRISQVLDGIVIKHA